MINAKIKKYTSDEFLAMTDLKGRYELIGGDIYDMAPAPSDIHQKLSVGLSSTIWHYIKTNSGKCEIREAPSDVKLDDENTVQPDVYVVCDPGKFDKHGCVGAPDWVIEIISPSDPTHDTTVKLDLYMKAGVREYWVVDPDVQRVFVYLFDKANAVGIFTFDDEITAGIYQNAEIPLVIKIRDIM